MIKVVTIILMVMMIRIKISTFLKITKITMKILQLSLILVLKIIFKKSKKIIELKVTLLF